MTLLDVFLEHRESQVQIGWIGFGGSLAGAAGGVLIGTAPRGGDATLPRLSMASWISRTTWATLTT